MPEQSRRILRFAFAFAILVYIGVVEFLTHQPDYAAQHANGAAMAHTLAPILAVVFVVGALIVCPLVTRGKPREQTFILRLAFYEAGAIYGLLLSFMSAVPDYVVMFGLPALALVLFMA